MKKNLIILSINYFFKIYYFSSPIYIEGKDKKKRKDSICLVIHQKMNMYI